MTRQTIKYESTEVDVERTLAELASLIRDHGGRRFEQTWDSDGRVVAVRFSMDHPQLGKLPVHLPARTAKILRILDEAGKWRSYGEDERRTKLAEQAECIAWRHIRDLTEQLLLSVRLELKTLPEAFFADVEMLDAATGETVRMAEYLERRASLGPDGLELVSAEENRRAIPLPSGASGGDGVG